MTADGGDDVPLRITRDRDGLLAALAAIDNEGWDGPVAELLLRFVRDEIARPLAIESGLRGTAASQGEASAWEAVWINLTKPGLRRSASPWGVLWQSARRAVLGEIIAARYVTTEANAWELRRPRRGRDPVRMPTSLDALLAAGWEPVDRSADHVSDDRALSEGLVRPAVRALARAGWPRLQAKQIVDAVIEIRAAPDERRSAVGWRPMAVKLELPPWQARRLCVVLRGTTTWPGLFARLLTDGPRAAQNPQMRAALRATRVRRHRSPALAAELAAMSQGGHPQDLAS
ncbi:hypothetical protein ACPPVS_12620 [Cellulomonas sp. McL0617]|uniref:hypothetical protein n=1 Tax=Cellulomonas sp. McL0617 TaxID=3415675 RepID=UPI003CF7493D